MASASWDETFFKWKDISVPESIDIDIVCAKEDMFQVNRCSTLLLRYAHKFHKD